MLLALMFLNAMFLAMTITSVRMVLKKPSKKIPRWLEMLFVRPNQIVNSQNSCDTVASISIALEDQSKNKLWSSEMKTESATISNEDDENKWKKVTDSVNMTLFWIFALVLIIMTLIIMISMSTS